MAGGIAHHNKSIPHTQRMGSQQISLHSQQVAPAVGKCRVVSIPPCAGSDCIPPRTRAHAPSGYPPHQSRLHQPRKADWRLPTVCGSPFAQQDPSPPQTQIPTICQLLGKLGGLVGFKAWSSLHHAQGFLPIGWTLRNKVNCFPHCSDVQGGTTASPNDNCSCLPECQGIFTEVISSRRNRDPSSHLLGPASIGHGGQLRGWNCKVHLTQAM